MSNGTSKLKNLLLTRCPTVTVRNCHRFVIYFQVPAAALILAPVADATAGRVVTAATRGTVLIRIADNAHDIELRTAAIVPSFSFVAIVLRITPAKGSRAGWLAGPV